MQFPVKRWIRPEAPVAAERAHGADLVRTLLDARGIRTAAARDTFCRPQLTHLQHPSEMHGTIEAARAICAALRTGRHIAIYGDYDVDGIMATAILWHMIRALAPQAPIRTYVPHRIEEGYGLNDDALRTLRAEGVDMVITVDCGVSAIAEARVAAEIGLELVITDHHELQPTGEVPVARAVVHPRLPSAQRFGELCGAGVAWKLAWMIAEVWCGVDRESRDAAEKRAPLPEVLRKRLLSLLPLASIGTVADVVPMLEENRVIVARGLTEIHHTGVVGLNALLVSARLDSGPVDAEKVAFRLAPRINACGRMGHAEDAIELFTTANASRAEELSALLEELNEQRRTDDRAIFDEALAQVRARHGDGKPRGIVLADEKWNLGIVGIVCSKLVDIYACPVILLTRNKDVYKGSGRSVPGIELHKVLADCSEHLLAFGGHAMAAGVKLDGSRIAAFTAAFEAAVDAVLPPSDQQKPPLSIDCVCAIDDLDLATIQQIDALAPFGRENRKPSMLVEGVEITQLRVMGRAANHLEVNVRQRSNGQMRFLRMHWWDGAKHAQFLAKGTYIDVVVEPALNNFRGIAEVEAKLVDFCVRPT